MSATNNVSDMSEDTSSEGNRRTRKIQEAQTTICICCKRKFSTIYCATNLSMLKAMLFDRVTGHTSVQMPFKGKPDSSCSVSGRTANRNNRKSACRKDILLPLCDCGRQKQTSTSFSATNITQVLTSDSNQTVVMNDTYDVESTHWICASCMAQKYTETAAPLVEYTYDMCVSTNGTQTTWHEGVDTELLDSTSLGMRFGRRVGGPSVRRPGLDRCCAPGCHRNVSAVALTMMLVIIESQYSDYTRMKNCWLNECTRNARLRKLIRDLQHYLLFDKTMHSASLRLNQTSNALRVEVERKVDLPPHQRAPNEPPSEQIQTLKYSSTRSKATNKKEVSQNTTDYQLHDQPPCILFDIKDREKKHRNGQLQNDHDLHEPRERWLFEALGMHHDFDQATVPINAQALTRSERVALQKALALL